MDRSDSDMYWTDPAASPSSSNRSISEKSFINLFRSVIHFEACRVLSDQSLHSLYKRGTLTDIPLLFILQTYINGRRVIYITSYINYFDRIQRNTIA